MPSLHPALYDSGYPHTATTPHGGPDHFVPEGWEELDRGVCPCGELVRWNAERERWIPDRSLRLLVLGEHEANTVRDRFERHSVTYPGMRDLIDHQLRLNEPYDELSVPLTCAHGLSTDVPCADCPPNAIERSDGVVVAI